jgi:hypothetical protein
MLAHYPFKGDANDASGNEHHGMIYGGATFTADKSGTANGAIALDGVDDYVELPNENAFDLDEFTIAATIKVPDYQQENWIISKGNYFGNYRLYIMDDQQAYWPGYAGYLHQVPLGNWSSKVSRGPVPINEFFNIAVTVNPAEFNAYINGELTGTIPVPHYVPPLLFNDEPVIIGGGIYHCWSYFFKGVVDEVRIYNHVLSDSEIWNIHYLTTYTGDTPPGLNVIVQPTSQTSSDTPVTLTFDAVTGSGTTSVIAGSTGPTQPSGFKLGNPPIYYEISTTATFTGQVKVCIDYSGMSYTNESSLRLMHYVDTDSDGTADAWVDATTSLDTGANIICGTVTSLSFFGVFEELENQPPVVETISAPLEPVQVNTEVAVSAAFWDPDEGDTHAAEWYWGDGSTSAGVVDEINGTVDGSHNYSTAGVYTVTLTLTDAAGASDEAVFQYVVVYDPSAGFVTGGGWIYSPDGALLDSAAEGKASFGFVAKYRKGATVPTGNTEFRFRAGNFRFKSSSYEWLVVAGTKAMFKGEGSIDGMDGSFKFMLTGVDDTEDKFRIKISDPAGEDPIYDNKRGEGDDAEPTTIGGGSIVIHGG